MAVTCVQAKRQDCTKSWRQSCALAGQVSKDPGGFWLGSGCNDWKVLFLGFGWCEGHQKPYIHCGYGIQIPFLQVPPTPNEEGLQKKATYETMKPPKFSPKMPNGSGGACVEEFRGRLL